MMPRYRCFPTRSGATRLSAAILDGIIRNCERNRPDHPFQHPLPHHHPFTGHRSLRRVPPQSPKPAPTAVRSLPLKHSLPD